MEHPGRVEGGARRGRRWPLALAALVLLAIVASRLLPPRAAGAGPPVAPRTEAGERAVVPTATGDGATPPGDPTAGPETVAEPVRLRLLDVLTGAPIPGIETTVEPPDDAPAGEAPRRIPSDGSGRIELPWRSARRVAVDAPNFRVVLGDSPHPNPRSGSDVWVVRLVPVRITVESADSGEPLPEARALARSSTRAPGEWISDGSRIGSAGWLDEACPDLSTRPFEVGGPRQVVMLPAAEEVVIVASAPGHDVGRLVLRASGMTAVTPEEALDVRLALSRSRAYRVAVRDREGRPVAGASVRHVETFEAAAGEFNVEWIAAENALTGSPITVQQTGDRMWYQAFDSGEADPRGTARLAPPFRGSDSALVVTAPGFAPVVRRPAPSGGDGGDGDEPVPIVLEPVEPLVDRYRFVDLDRPLGGARVHLALRVDRWLAPVADAVLGPDGGMDASLVRPGLPYEVFLHEPEDGSGRGQRRGSVLFDRDDRIDVSEFARRR